MIMIINLIFNFTNFFIVICLFTKLLTSGILFSTAVNAELVPKPVILGILPSVSVILTLKSVFLARLLASRIFLSPSLIFFSTNFANSTNFLLLLLLISHIQSF